MPKPTHPVVAAWTAKDTVLFSQFTVQNSFIFSEVSKTASWENSVDKSAPLAGTKAEIAINTKENMLPALACCCSFDN